MTPKKLIREGILAKLNLNESKIITDSSELNELYALKVKEELFEIQASAHADILEFVDLIQVVVSWALINGFSREELDIAAKAKHKSRGIFGNTVLTNLNPNNPSNAIYFNEAKEKADCYWTDTEVIDFVNWYMQVHKLSFNYNLENREIIDSFKRGDLASKWH